MEKLVQLLSVETTIVSPGAMLNGALVMLGRTAGEPSALSRYGGVKICPSGWFCLRDGCTTRGQLRSSRHGHSGEAACLLPACPKPAFVPSYCRLRSLGIPSPGWRRSCASPFAAYLTWPWLVQTQVLMVLHKDGLPPAQGTVSDPALGQPLRWRDRFTVRRHFGGSNVRACWWETHAQPTPQRPAPPLKMRASGSSSEMLW